jgi:hypothetical protein
VETKASNSGDQDSKEVETKPAENSKETTQLQPVAESQPKQDQALPVVAESKIKEESKYVVAAITDGKIDAVDSSSQKLVK